MNNDQIDLANETVQELSNLKEFIRRLHLQQRIKIRHLAFLQASESRLEDEPLSLDIIKLQLIIKLQQQVLKQSSITPPTPSTIIQTECTIVNIFQQLSDKLPVTQPILILRTVIIILDFKVHLKHERTPKLNFEELLPLFDQINLWQLYEQSTHTYVRYFYLCFIYQHLSEEEIDHCFEALIEFIHHLFGWVERQRSQNTEEDCQHLLIMLLHMHLTYKSLKKQFQETLQLPNEHQIYSLLYDLDYSITQQASYQYKKLHTQPRPQFLIHLKLKLAQLILQYDQSTIETECNLLKQHRMKSTFKIKKSASTQSIKRKSIDARAKQPTIKLLPTQPLNIQNNIFVPKTINYNHKLERRLQLKKEQTPPLAASKNRPRKSSIWNTKSNLPKPALSLNESQTRKVNPPALNRSKSLHQSQKANTYQACKKASLNQSFQLQLMICNRSNNFNLKVQGSPNEGNKEHPQKHKSVPNRKGHRLAKKSSVHFSQIKIGEDHIEVIQAHGGSSQISFPPTIKKIFQKYLKGFHIWLDYYKTKHSLPLYQYFSQLKTSIPYYLKGVFLTFHQIEEDYLSMKIVYQENQKQYKKVRFDLDEQQSSKVRALFYKGEDKPHLRDFFLVGRLISFYTLNLQAPTRPTLQKFKILSITDQPQIYSHTALLTTPFRKCLSKKILQAHNKFMDRLNQSLQIPFDYYLPLSSNSIKTTINYTHKPRLCHFFHQDKINTPLQLLLIQQVCTALKIQGGYTLSSISLLQSIPTQDYYLSFQNKSQKTHFKQRAVVPCHKLRLHDLLRQVFSWKDLKHKLAQHLIQREWIDVQLNQTILRLNSIKYAAPTQHKGYQVITSHPLTHHGLNVLSGQDKKSRWFCLIQLHQFEPNLAVCNLLRRDKKRDRHNNSPTLDKLGIPLSNQQLKQQMIQLWRKQQIKHIQITNKSVSLERHQYKLFHYHHSWTLHLQRKHYHCYSYHNQILTYKTINHSLLYIRRYVLQQPTHNKQHLYGQFRTLLLQELTTRKIVISEWAMVVTASMESNTVNCVVNDAEGSCNLQIEADQMSLFRPAHLNLDYTIFRNKQYVRRLTKIFKTKFKRHQEHQEQQL